MYVGARRAVPLRGLHCCGVGGTACRGDPAGRPDNGRRTASPLREPARHVVPRYGMYVGARHTVPQRGYVVAGWGDGMSGRPGGRRAVWATHAMGVPTGGVLCVLCAFTSSAPLRPLRLCALCAFTSSAPLRPLRLCALCAFTSSAPLRPLRLCVKLFARPPCPTIWAVVE
ncbi:MAG: hypothetical protein KatS3mg055_2549 [Chloroflexus sp.]|nr:MAG: hypothetical protein KatS3mg055_2549 [Chloroflexus sp.]